MPNTRTPIAQAARLLRAAAKDIKDCHTRGDEDWTGELEALAAHDEHLAAAQAQEDARDALTLEELDQLDRAIEHFVEGEDTDVDWRLLTRAASLGYLECERFTVPPTARAAIDAARAAQGGDKP